MAVLWNRIWNFILSPIVSGYPVHPLDRLPNKSVAVSPVNLASVVFKTTPFSEKAIQLVKAAAKIFYEFMGIPSKLKLRVITTIFT